MQYVCCQFFFYIIIKRERDVKRNIYGHKIYRSALLFQQCNQVSSKYVKLHITKNAHITRAIELE